jgi:cobalamin biosynthesis Mg chelatase CobN
MIGCSNPQSQEEVQKLLQSEGELLESDKSVEEELKPFKSVNDSVDHNVKENNKSVPQIDDQQEVSLDSLNRQIKNLSQQVNDLEKSLEQIKNKLQFLEQKEDRTKEAELKEKKEMPEEKDLEVIENASDEDLVKNEKEPGEKLLERLESKSKTEQSQSDGSGKKLAAKDTNKKELSIEQDTASNKPAAILKSDSSSKLQKSEDVKSTDSAKLLIKKKTEIKQKKSKGVDSTTKIVTIILAIGLVLFIFLYMVGKHGAAKKKSSKKK